MHRRRWRDFTSLDGLRRSIEAGVIRDRRAGTSSIGFVTQELTPVIEQQLFGEARRNEQGIALFRFWLTGAYVGLSIVGRLLHGAPSIPTILVLAVWCGASFGLYKRLQDEHWYPVQLRRAVPLGDAVAIAAGAWLASRSAVSDGAGGSLILASSGALAANVGLLCAFLIVTGALRLTYSSAKLSAALAIVVFVLVAGWIAPLPWLSVVTIVVGLFTLGLLTRLMVDATRRVIATEVDRSAMERQVERTRARVAEAQAASAAREQVLRIVAHDLRNPLGTLLMSADMLGEASISDAQRAKFAGMVKRSGASMNRLIQDLLNVARMEQGKLTVDPKPVAAEVLIANAIEARWPLAEEKSLALVSNAGAVRQTSNVPWNTAALPLVHADASRVGQVFSNLIGNAIKFTPAGGSIVLRAEAVDGKVYFSVTDTGPGMTAEQLSRVFEGFWQGRRDDGRGIGLGLTIAKGIVEAHGGTIGVSSELNVGTRFWFGLSSVAAADPSQQSTRL
jgi:signal transduction histidine kinase